MQRKLALMLALVLVVPGLMFVTSCAKKKVVKSEPTSVYEDDVLMRETGPAISDEDGLTRRQEQAIEEERLRQERLRREEQERLRGGRYADTGVVATRTSRMSFMEEDVYFSYDSAALSSDAQAVLRQKAEWMRRNPNVSVIIEGHCDERGTNAYNMALGDRRAESVKAFLANLGVSRSRMTTISYGEERPVLPGHNESAWARNRRAHFVLE